MGSTKITIIQNLVQTIMKYYASCLISKKVVSLMLIGKSNLLDASPPGTNVYSANMIMSSFIQFKWFESFPLAQKLGKDFLFSNWSRNLGVDYRPPQYMAAIWRRNGKERKGDKEYIVLLPLLPILDEGAK